MVASPFILVVPYETPTDATGRAGGIYWGSGEPDATNIAPQSSLYVNSTAAAAATRLYVAADSAGTWASFTASA